LDIIDFDFDNKVRLHPNSRSLSLAHVDAIAKPGIQFHLMLPAKAYFMDYPGSHERNFVLELGARAGKSHLSYDEQRDAVKDKLIEHIQNGSLPSGIKIPLISGNHSSCAIIKVLKEKKEAKETEIPREYTFR
jgi:hypothetical protein